MGDYEQLLELKLSIPDWENLKLIQFERSLYEESEEVSNRTEQEVEEWKSKTGITVTQLTGEPLKIPKPITSFDETKLPGFLIDKCEELGIINWTSIQSQALPLLLSGFDSIVVAETGSGKTLTYILPAIIHIINQPLLEKNDGPIALAIPPTRELAIQIYSEAVKFAETCRIRAYCIYGGVRKADQIKQCHRIEFLVATPGRLIDLITSEVISTLRVTFLILDEADKLLSLGFGPYIEKIKSYVRTDIQTVLLTATFPKEVLDLAVSTHSSGLPLLAVTSGSSNSKSDIGITSSVCSISTSTSQSVVVFNGEDERRSLLVKFINNFIISKNITDSHSKLLVFCATQKRVDDVVRYTKTILNDSIPVLSIHGGMDQQSRESMLSHYKEHVSSKCVLIATSILARGIHIPDVSHILNYDFPQSLEEYIHRIGRCGRLSKKGQSTSFFTLSNLSLAAELVNYLQQCDQSIPQELYGMISVKTKTTSKRKTTEKSIHSWRKVGVAETQKSKQAKTTSSTIKDDDDEIDIEEEGMIACSRKPSEVLVLCNAVKSGEVDADLKEDIWTEAERISGANSVVDLIIHERKKWQSLTIISDEEAVSIFIKFRLPCQAAKVYTVMHGRQFGGRTVFASFYSVTAFDSNDFTIPALLSTTLLLRNMASPSDIDDSFVPDIVTEMSTFGLVEGCRIHITPTASGTAEDLAEQVRVFVKFRSPQGAAQALIHIDGRQFNKRCIAANLYDDVRWELEDFVPCSTIEPRVVL